jgi:hypothetical protein
MTRQWVWQTLIHLLAGAVTMICVAGTTDARTSSKLRCDVMKVGCANKTDPVIVHRLSQFVPKPKPKPMILRLDEAKSAAADRLQQYAPPAGDARFENPTEHQDMASCRAELVRIGVQFLVPDHVEGTGACSVADPVQLKSIETSVGRVELPGTPIVNCAFARQFATWLSDIAAPVVAALGQAGLTSLSTGPGYQCRGRKADPSAKMSEHAYGNAIDIDGITLANKKRIEILDVVDQQDSDHRLLMALRVSACGYFTTVLGPGADAAHASHYHFDLGIHGKSGNYRICQ